MGCPAVLKASRNRQGEGTNPPSCFIHCESSEMRRRGRFCIVSFQFGPRKGWVVKAGNVQRGLPHPQSAKNASPRGWQKLPNGGKRLPHAWF